MTLSQEWYSKEEKKNKEETEFQKIQHNIQFQETRPINIEVELRFFVDYENRTDNNNNSRRK